MTARIFTFALLLCFSLNASAQKADTAFQREWLSIDTLILDSDLSKTALAKVNQVYQSARRRQLPDHVIKALIYRFSIEERIVENQPDRNIHLLQTEIGETTDPVLRSLLYALLARQYQNYFFANRWRFYNREQSIDIKKDSIATWSLPDFTRAITKNYLLALSNVQLLQQKKVEQYSTVVVVGNARRLRPTLYDLIAHLALDYFKSAEEFNTVATTPFLIKDPVALAPENIFINASFAATDTVARWRALKLFQDLMRFHKDDVDKNAFVDLDIERIEWIYNAGSLGTARESLYKRALQHLTTIYPNTLRTAKAWYLLATLERNAASQYQPFGDTTNRYGLVKARQIAEHALSLFPGESLETGNLSQLIMEIRQTNIGTQTERVNVPGKPMRALLTYRNLDKVFVRILKQEGARKLLDKRWDSAFWKNLVHMPAYKSFTQPIPDPADHQQHSAEIKIDALPLGEYILLVCEKDSFRDDSDRMSIQSFIVSNISYVRSGNDYFVLTRNEGKPIQDARVEISGNITPKTVTRKTDANGFFSYSPTKRNESIELSITKGKDKLSMDGNAREWVYSFSNDYDNNAETDEKYEKNNQRIFFFTDRSIYRPGQTVFFKGIAVTRDRKTGKSKVVSIQKENWLYLRDVNRKEIDSLRFTLNEYGSFSGSFKLPQNLLTGEFDLNTADFGEANGNFRVEEYKRPTFSVSFDKKKGAYRLNDSISLTGTATAYSGNAVNDAKVSYRVVRNARFTDPWYRPRTYNYASREIKSGEVTTDGQGRFSIDFRALADDVKERTGNPVFDYSISVDITDMNGETRSGSTRISIGYTAVQVSLNVPQVNDADSLKKIGVSVANMSGEPEPSVVTVKIFPLQAPAAFIRKRYWQRPDQFVMTKQEFRSFFPTDEYEEETNQKTWPSHSAVKEATVNTKDADSVSLAPLAPGVYRIEAVTKDKYGESATSTQYITVFDKQNKSGFVPLEIAYTAKNYTEPGETAMFYVNRLTDHQYTIRRTDRETNRNGKYDFTEHPKGIEPVSYTAEEKDRGDIQIVEAYVTDNRMYTHVYRVMVPWSNKMLKVAYETYRNKTEPGSRETWTVSVTDDKNGKATAELLTGMYDASLDQIAAHDWLAPSIWQSRNWNNLFTGGTNFSFEMATPNNVPEPYIAVEKLIQNRLETNAYELARLKMLERLDSTRSTLPDKERKALAKRLNLMPGIINVVMTSDYSPLEEVVTVGYGAAKRQSLAGSVAGLQLRGAPSAAAPPPLYIVDGNIKEQAALPSNNEIANLTVLNGTDASALYGTKAGNGAVVITTREGQPLQQVVVRKNFTETAFFLPELHADSSGNYRFTFTIPESLTTWKWMSLAHTKDLAFGTQTATVITQKRLMAQGNAPRFMREGDNMEFSAKVVNMSEKEITGQASLELIDPITNTSVDGWFQNIFPTQYFTVGAGQSFALKFPVLVPYSYNKPLTWRIKAVSGDMSDGEENSLPVLSNRMLITETLPVFLQGDTTQHFTFDKLRNNKSESLSNESLTVEYTANPVWHAVQSLPYLMEYPHDCAEQTFNKLYANLLASYVVNQHPRIKQVFDQWMKDSVAMKSNLQKNEELKQVLLQETPWVLDAESEAQKRKNIAQLFDLVKLSTQTESVFQKFSQLQMPSGGFAWFKGGREDRYITNYVLTGIGKLKRLGALSPDVALRMRPLIVNALKYLDGEMKKDYDRLVLVKENLSKQNLYGTQVAYLYMRSFFRDIAIQHRKEYDYYFSQGKKFWNKQNSYARAQLGLVYLRNNEEAFASETILPSLLENTVLDSKQGMHWKDQYTNYWYSSPIEHQSMMISFASELNLNKPGASLKADIDAMKTWLLLNKQTNSWRTTIATAEAIYALLLNGSDWASQEKTVTVQLGNTIIGSASEKTEAGSGYFKKRIDGKSVTPEMGDITVRVSTKGAQNTQTGPSWGNVYWQYFEDMEKITPAATPLSLTKKLFIQRNTDKGVVLDPVKDNEELKTGDKIVARITLRSDRDMDYLHLKDMRAASMEPVNVLSGYKWQDGLGYYEATKDASTNFFIDHLRKGTYVFDYPLFITHTGIFSVGVATIQCMYAPEFTSHSEGIKIRVAK